MSRLWRSKKSRRRGLGPLARERANVSHGGYHLNDGRAGRLHIATIVQHRRVCRPVHDTVLAVGRESGQVVLQIEPLGLLCAGTDHRQWLVAQASQAARLGGGLRGGTKL